uniref:MYCBP associated protein n=1 Tax=Coturnix japonica TaxID=93934 RepID=A0A8C2UKX2_COTJA
EPEEPRPALCPLRVRDVRELAVRDEELHRLHAPRPPRDAGRILVRRKFLVRKHQPRLARKAAQLLVARPAFTRTAREPPRFSGRVELQSALEILPHHVLGSLQELEMEALARGNTQMVDLIQVPRQRVAALLKEQRGGETKRRFRQSPTSEHKALQNWHRNMAIRKKQERNLGEILQKPENELLMSIVEGYRQIQEERDLIDRNLALRCLGSEFWSQPERIGDELTGLTVTLTRTERGCPEPVTHVGKPHTVKMETGKGVCREQQDEVIPPSGTEAASQLPLVGPAVSTGLVGVSEGRSKRCVLILKSPLEMSFTPQKHCHFFSSDSLRDNCREVPETALGPSLDFCGQPARWIDRIASCRDEVGIAARITFETVVGEKAESFLTVSNDGTAAVWYDWRRLPQHIPSRGTTRTRMRCFYFDARPGVILPGETRRFFFLFKSERTGIFSESWELRTHPLLLGGALLQVTLWGIAVCEDKLADLREKLEADLAAREGAVIVEETLKDLLVQIRTPERSPSPVGVYVTDEELFHRKNPKLHYQHRVVEQLRDLWRQHVAAPSACGEEVPSDQEGAVDGWKSTIEVTPSQVANVEEEEPSASGWNFSALKSIPQEEQREAALCQLNKAVLELCAEQRPIQSDLLYQTCLQLWREAVDGLVGHSLRLRSQLGFPEKDTSGDDLPEGGGERWLQHSGRILGIVGKPKNSLSFSWDGSSQEHPTSRKSKAKEKKRLKSRGSLEKEIAQPIEAAAPDPVTLPQEQIDPIIWALYQEKLYVEVSPAKVCTFISGFCSLLLN